MGFDVKVNDEHSARSTQFGREVCVSWVLKAFCTFLLRDQKDHSHITSLSDFPSLGRSYTLIPIFPYILFHSTCRKSLPGVGFFTTSPQPECGDQSFEKASVRN